jgi:cytochrome c-type biogenesis protein
MLTSIGLGLLASFSPCVLPLYPGYLAYLSGVNDDAKGRSRYFLGLKGGVVIF